MSLSDVTDTELIRDCMCSGVFIMSHQFVKLDGSSNEYERNGEHLIVPNLYEFTCLLRRPSRDGREGNILNLIKILVNKICRTDPKLPEYIRPNRGLLHSHSGRLWKITSCAAS